MVGHITYGRAEFPGKTNVAGLDLDDIGMNAPGVKPSTKYFVNIIVHIIEIKAIHCVCWFQ